MTAGERAALQGELVAINAEATAKVSSLEETIGNLAHENELGTRSARSC